MNITIIGKGNFGSFLPKLLPSTASINFITFDTSREEKEKLISKADIIFLATPFKSYPDYTIILKKNLKPKTLLIDIASIKVAPQKFFFDNFGAHQNYLISHPLFGPQSAAKSTAGLKLIITAKQGALAEKVINYAKADLKLDIIEITAEQHDQQMALSQSLTFFISEALDELPLDTISISTPSFIKLQQLAQASTLESQELLTSLQSDNPFAKKIRDDFINALTQISQKYKS